MSKIKNNKILVFFLFGVFFFFNLFILSDYGISWDEPIHNIRGQAYLQYFLTGNGDKKVVGSRVSIYQNRYYDKIPGNFSYWIKNDSGHPPINGILSSLTNYIFFQKLGVMGDVESYHLFILFVSSLLVGIVFLFIAETYGLFPGIIAFLSIILYPLFFGESHFNIKDPVETAFYVGAIYGFYKGITRDSWKWIIISAFSAGIAFGTKFNILFVVFSLFPWIVIYKWKYIVLKKWPFSFSVTISLILYSFIVFSLFYLTWPFLWNDTLTNLFKIVNYYKEIGSITYQSSEYLTIANLNIYPIQWIFYTTPIITLFLFVLGCVYTFTLGIKEKNKTSLLILFFFLVPIIRVSLPNTGIYGGVRQIMEYIPAMAMLCGVGSYFLIKVLAYNFKKKTYVNVAYIVMVLLYIPIIFNLITIHPNENVYFNQLIGGLKGAKEKNIMYWGFTFGNAYRQGVEWLNRNADRNSNMSLGMGLENEVFNIWLREDISYSNKFRSGLERKGEYVMELTGDMPSWPPYYFYTYVKTVLKPIYEVNVDNVPILKIWKNDLSNTKEEFKHEETVKEIKNIKHENNAVVLDLINTVNLTELIINFSNKDCNFTNEGFLSTSDGNIWTDQPGNLGSIPFYNKYKTRPDNTTFAYIFPAIRARYIKIIHSEMNDCFKHIKDVIVKKI